jgi:hypothetical protein
MIRRNAGDDFLLIAQSDHAALAGELAARFGNGLFARPQNRHAVLTAINLHDQGWPIHDDEPTLNDRGQPRDVFEMPRDIDLQVWAASADRAAAVDPYAGLLVSLHSLALSAHTTASLTAKSGQFDPQKMHEQFALNKFQHREIERQEQLRRELGMDLNVPTKLGLAEPRASETEDRVLFDFRLLQAMDLISLNLCCSHWPADHADEVFHSPGGDAVTLKIRRYSATELTVTPWPFEAQRIDLAVKFRRMRAVAFASVEEFREAYRSAGTEELRVAVSV